MNKHEKLPGSQLSREINAQIAYEGVPKTRCNNIYNTQKLLTSIYNTETGLGETQKIRPTVDLGFTVDSSTTNCELQVQICLIQSRLSYPTRVIAHRRENDNVNDNERLREMIVQCESTRIGALPAIMSAGTIRSRAARLM